MSNTVILILSFLVFSVLFPSIKCLDNIISECSPHCSLCYNETECYECTQGFYLDENGQCKRK